MIRTIWKLLGVILGSNAQIGIGVFLGNRKHIHIGNNVGLGIGFHISVSEKGRLIIGNNTQINRFFTCGAADDVTIGDDCLFSYNISIISANHSFGINEIPGRREDVTAPIKIGNRCFIGCGVVILKGVTLGDNCVVGANAVVTSSFPKGSVIGGNPAILIRSL